MFKTKKKFLMAFLSLMLTAQYGCQKDTTEPTDSSTITEVMYSPGAKSVTADMIQTSDGGYLMVGTSYPSNNTEGDIVVVKTDSRGVEQWATLMGKVQNAGTGSLAGQIVKYDEEGVKAVELPDGSYIIAANRTYVAYPTTSSTSGVLKHSKIVIYQISASGIATTNDGVELRNNTEFTDKVSDFKIDASNGTIQYILTGYTTDIQTNKPNDSSNGAHDLTDILTISLDANLNITWTTFSLAYGFSGQDYGTSIQILPSGYLVVGTSEERTSGTSFKSRIITVLLGKTGGTPLNVAYFLNQGCEFEAIHSVYDAPNGLITIVGSVVAGTSSFTGQLAALQINESLTQTLPSSASSNLEFINPTAPSTTSINNSFKAASIALIPNNGGFAISSTMSDNLGKDICISKLGTDLSLPATGWPHYYTNAASTSQELAGPVIPMVDANGTTEYAYTGTFNANTSTSQIGWVLF